MALLICEECGRIDGHHPHCPNNDYSDYQENDQEDIDFDVLRDFEDLL